MAKSKQNKIQTKITLDTHQTQLPHAFDIEQSVLGAALSDSHSLSKVIEFIQNEEVFYYEAHQKIFRIIKALYNFGTQVDTLVVVEELRRRNDLEEVGGAAYIASLSNNILSQAYVDQHCKILIEKYMLRQLINHSLRIAQLCYENQKDTFEILDEAESGIFEISENKYKKTYFSIKSILPSTVEIINKARDKQISGIATGFYKFDELTDGLHNSDLIILAARPGVGKTALALSIARNITKNLELPVGFFSLEMSLQQIILRLLSMESGISMLKLRSKRLNNDEELNLMKAIRALSNYNIFIDDTPALSLLELRAKARRMIVEEGVKIIFVDYLQLMQGPANSETREREISFISRGLKSLAKELDIPVVALAQLNRQVEARRDRRPILSDLRESGAIEQDADIVTFIHRPETSVEEDEINTRNLVEIIIAKQRNGPTAEFPLVFIPNAARFENPELDFALNYKVSNLAGQNQFPDIDREPNF